MAFGRVRKTAWLVIAALVAIAAGAIRNEWLGPMIRPVAVMSADPLTLRFTISNPAFLVPLKDIDMTCVPLRLAGHVGSGSWTAAAQSFPLDVDIDLGPRMVFDYTCPIESAAIKGPVDKVEARVAIRFTRLGRREESQSALLSWDSVSKVWTQSER